MNERIYSKPKVLLVDDEPDARFLASEILKKDCEVKDAENVHGALDLLSAWVPDMILSDIKMPGEDGISLLKKVKALKPGLPVVLITGHADKQIAIDAIKEGAFDFIEKPFEDDELLAVVKRATDTVILRRKLDEARARSIESEKLATIGLMAGGIAHEINTPLGAILLMATSLETVKEDPEQVSKTAEQIASTVGRISRIIKSLQSFSRDSQNTPFLDVHLKDIVSGVLDLCSKKFVNSGVDLRIDDPSIENIVIQCRESEIAQVVFNLVNNAKDAVATLSEKWVKLECKNENGHVKILITDSGPGIPEDIRNKIFLPFFTTKDVGQGTGLGLSVSVGIIEAHSGKLEVDPTKPNTTFVVQLPKVQVHNLNEQAS